MKIDRKFLGRLAYYFAGIAIGLLLLGLIQSKRAKRAIPPDQQAPVSETAPADSSAAVSDTMPAPVSVDPTP